MDIKRVLLADKTPYTYIYYLLLKKPVLKHLILLVERYSVHLLFIEK